MGSHCSCTAPEHEEITVEGGINVDVSHGDPYSKGSSDVDISQEYQLDTADDSGILAHSSLGTVMKTRHRKSKRVHAVKQIAKENIEGNDWKADIELMKELDHPNICKLHDTWEDAMHVYLVMEFCRGGQLTGLGGAPEEQVNECTIAVLVRQMVGAVGHLHEHKVVHSDIRPENWLFERPITADSEAASSRGEQSALDMQLKMIDFGLATKHGRARQQLTDGAMPAYGGLGHAVQRRERSLVAMHSQALPSAPRRRRSLRFNPDREDRSLFCKAPEQVLGSNGSASSSSSGGNSAMKEKADIWALGIISYFLLSGQSPFQGPYDTDALYRNANFVFMPADLWRPVSSEAKHFIAMCLQRDPEARLPAAAALKLPWMQLAKSALDEAAQMRHNGRSPPGGWSNRSKLSVLDPALPAARRIKSSFERMNILNVLEKAAVIAAAHRLPPGKITELGEVFESMDKHSQGVITTEEMFLGLQRCGVPCEELMSLVKGTDVETSRSIDYRLFVAGIEDFQRNVQDSVVWAVFRNFDNQSVVKKKLVEALAHSTHRRSLEANFPEVGLEEVLEELDHDRNGMIDLQEFKHILRTSGRSRSSAASSSRENGASTSLASVV